MKVANRITKNNKKRWGKFSKFTSLLEKFKQNLNKTSQGKYLCVGLLFLTGFLYNNYDTVLKVFFLSNSKIKKVLDNWHGNLPIEKIVKIEIPVDVK